MPEINSTALVLQTSDNQHIGFTLFSPHLDAAFGNCVFVIAPMDDDILNTAEVNLLTSINMAGQHQWKKRDNDIIVSLDGKECLKYSQCGKLQSIPEIKNLGVWVEF